jgi:hypothetical protein
MTLDKPRVRERLRQFGLKALLIDELGWDHHNQTVTVTLDGSTIELSALAQKRGMVAFHCPTLSGHPIPNHAQRRVIERQVAKAIHEHLIVFTDAGSDTQVWQWVKREPGKPTACREHTYHRSQPGDALIQKLSGIAFTFDEEGDLSLPVVSQRVGDAFDVERVTKRFYDRFQKEHTAFLTLIKGITESTDREWYASVMLNRLMFVYFIQRKGFLDGDTDYLRNRLSRMQAQHRQENFYSFYRYFLLRLFHEGLGGKSRPKHLEALVGCIPYLNGGLFDIHELERPDRYGDAIQIPDKAFERLFDFFDDYQWQLDERPLRKDNEINPDVLGYIFEKYVNQKQMGAYYTKEDITEYISKAALLPFVLNAARAKCKVAFENASGPTVWDLLKNDPDRYVYEQVRRGCGQELPEDIAAGINPPSLHDTVRDDPVTTLELRKAWNATAPETHALPTETWREVITRRSHYDEIGTRLASGDIRHVNDLVTFNLNIRQFVQDAIEGCEGPELLRAFWHAIEKVTILDPTCGSGAFLFAALNILEPLYEACLDRMEAFVEDHARSGEKHRPEKYSDFRAVLARVSDHPNRRYFIFKSIILNNLFGVDIMEEAVEICKLRLFLKLAAQVEPDAGRDNLGIEPLPDVDFNIRVGNTLVGYATLDAVRQSLASSLDFDNAATNIERKAADVQQSFDAFRSRQIDTDGSIPAADKQALRSRLNALGDELNRYLAADYGITYSKKASFLAWVESHQPFHWAVEFYGIVTTGGFDVIIGNPPYLEQREVDYEVKGLKSADSKAVHAMCIERSLELLHHKGSLSMIVPLSLPSTQRMAVVQAMIEGHGSTWYANFAWRPGKLFDTVNRALSIFVVLPSTRGRTWSTTYQKWTSHDRAGLFERLYYVEVSRKRPAFWVPKLGDPREIAILAKFLGVRTLVNHFVGNTGHKVFYRTDGGLYWKVFTDFAPAFKVNGKAGHSTRETWFTVRDRDSVRSVIAALSSDLFWWWYSVTSNCRHLNPYDVQHFPLPETAIGDRTLVALGGRYVEDLKVNSTMLTRQQRQTGRTQTQSFKIQKSKLIIDVIDTTLAKHYKLTEEELDFISNYDIKYRMGLGAVEEGD